MPGIGNNPHLRMDSIFYGLAMPAIFQNHSRYVDVAMVTAGRTNTEGRRAMTARAMDADIARYFGALDSEVRE